MGTPNFAVPILEKINSRHDVILVVTQPDQYNKRKKTYEPTPVKVWAEEHNIEVFQPESIKTEKQKILDYDVDLIITAAYGQFIPKVILDHPKYKSINVHGSILPKYRGGAPIQRAIINGDSKTGITIMYMGPKMDAGDIIKINEIDILDSDTQDTLFEKLSTLGSEMILKVIKEIKNKKVNPVKQDLEKVTFAYNLNKEDELIDFKTKDAREVFNQIRGLNSNPGAYFTLDNINIKVYNSKEANYQTNKDPGLIININKDSFDVSCKNNTVISITEIQLPGKNKIHVKEFLNGSGKKLIKENKPSVNKSTFKTKKI